jgi:hypothetical protein
VVPCPGCGLPDSSSVMFLSMAKLGSETVLSWCRRAWRCRGWLGCGRRQADWSLYGPGEVSRLSARAGDTSVFRNALGACVPWERAGYSILEVGYFARHSRVWGHLQQLTAWAQMIGCEP